ncbi:acyl transferase/acyl hydrolase/lysophospholipase [Podospora fimiseda]|uniref:Acyl transferase/acyl hydrolase/lysophospholipase n=1 Tax=Podospora fimiseda TaxID=252190 RepID=A0AAN6YRE8_9PEZI|nr:acyl transferase/acyl hydrolase/lysophospholipase [Podospora fimiseda]
MAPMMFSDTPSEGLSTPESSTPPKLTGSEPIAICGFACRLPGDASSPDRFWDLISKGRSAQCHVPNSRFNVDGFYHPQGQDRPGSMKMKGGYFLQEDVRQFENSFFGINNLEATYMDPQQRKLLEVVYECMENAGIPLDKASGSNTGCYVGNFTVDFQVMQLRDSDYLNRYSGTGLGTTILANRISHVFNLLGPSLVLDTACSSSLYCLHVACSALENYECDAAIVAGGNLIQSAEQHIATMKAGVLSPTSTCHTFDSSADGYGRGDGVGALYIKRLRDAIRDGDPIRSVIRGNAVNANGRTSGISLPSADGQELVIRKALAKAGLGPDDISYIECHGTGTKVGDAIEVDALARVFQRQGKDPLIIGAVKTNVGHSEAASGITSVIKSTLALEKGQIPPTHGVKNINPKLKIEERNISIPTELVSWPEIPGRVRRAGINSFGYGGANSHTILEEASGLVRRSLAGVPELRPPPSQSAVVLPLSAASESSLEARVIDFANYDFSRVDLSDLAFTLGSRRTQFPVRGYVVARHGDNITDLFKTGKVVSSPNAVKPSRNPYAFVFTGQGSQWPGMCQALFSEFPVFRRAITEMDAALKALPHAPEWSLQEAILDTANPDLIHMPQRSQPCCTAIQVGLIQLLASWDILPSVTVGHSSGEIAAAFAAGHLSAAEAIVIAYYRGYLVSENHNDGAMMAVGLSEAAASVEISENGFDGQLRVACINSTEGVTVSGNHDAIDKLLKVLVDKKVFARKLKTGGQAYHSHHMLSIGEKYQSLLDQILPTLEPSLKLEKGATFISSVTVRPKRSGFSGSYWRANLESQVRFAPAIEHIQTRADYGFIELGPHGSMELPIRQTLSGTQVKYAVPIKRNTDALQSVLSFAASLWMQGFSVDWSKVNGLKSSSTKLSTSSVYHVVKDLPPYRFDYKTTLWNECRASVEYRQRKHPRHELLGSLLPGGNGKDFIFRNVLRANDVPWVKDHRLGETIVFPGSGYMAMAIEAVRQAADISVSDSPSFHFSNLNILAALSLSEDPSASSEVFTSLHKSPLTRAADSTTWWDFSITTYSDNASTTHATGSISIKPTSTSLVQKYSPPTDDSLEPTAKRTWYERFVQQGLNYGTAFQTISQFDTPRMKAGNFCSAAAPLLTNSEEDPLTRYPAHPITLDALLQLAVVSAANGTPRDLRAVVPTRIVSAVVNTASALAAGQEGRLNTSIKRTGFGPIEAGCELIDSQGKVAVQFDQVRMNPYSAGTYNEESASTKRHPILRVLWKPDVYGLGYMSSLAAEKFAQKFSDESQSAVEDRSLIKFGGLVDLLVHKDPGMRVLELGNPSEELRGAILELLASKSDMKRFATYTKGEVSEEGEIVGGVVDLESNEAPEKLGGLEKGAYDLVLVPFGAEGWVRKSLPKITELLAEGGTIVSLFSEYRSDFIASEALTSLTVPVGHVNSGATAVVARHRTKSNAEALQKAKFLIVERSKTKLGSALQDSLSKIQGQGVSRTTLQALRAEHLPRGTTVFNLAELYDPLLSTISDEDMDRVKLITDKAARLVWVTGGDVLKADKPDFSLVSGLARAVGMEQPSLKFYTYGIDNPDAQVHTTAQRLISVLNQATPKPDMEFVQSEGVVHVSRFTPDDSVNADFRNKQGLESSPLKLGNAGDIRLTVEKPGQFDTIFYRQQQQENSIPGPNQVRIKVASVGINAKDYYVLAGRVDTPDGTCQLECAGTVVQVGSNVTNFAPGDRVVAMAPSHFQTYQTLPEWACHKLLLSENFNTAATLPLVYSTAIYALHHRAQIQPGETILIHSGAGGVGIAAIQLALAAGAQVFTTVSTEEKKQYLVSAFGLDPANVFSSRDTSFLEGVLSATNNRGVDVILNSLTGDQLHATWRCAASFGRFVEIGKLDLSTAGKLEMDQFLKNTTFTAFDLGNLYFTSNEQHHKLWNQLLVETFDLFRQGKIKAVEPLKVFDLSEATQAYRYFATRTRLGKIAINLEDPESEIQVQRLKHAASFSSDKSYVMVGCLGGLGRTLSRWMVSRGARKFAFLGRSGLKKPAAQNLVRDLQALGAETVVVTGDVCSSDDVNAVVDAAAKMGKLGGVVQAAMGLNEAIFSDMPNEYWHTGIDPKVKGTWYLYDAIRKGGGAKELEFFMMTSSVSGSVGTATESNYCAGNHFLDLFARFLRGKGLPGVSVGLGMISEVGYLHDNPEIEALLLRKGIQPIDSDELLQILDLSLTSGLKLGIHHPHDQLAAAHMLTGLEASGLQELRKKGFEGNHPVLEDARAGVLAAALGADAGSRAGTAGDGLPAEVVKAIEGGETLTQAVLDHVRRRFANLVLMKYEAVDVVKPLAEYGMDSMIGAEFRTWFYQSLKADVPLSLLLSKTCTLETLSELALEARDE